jgi:hypothetical protein
MQLIGHCFICPATGIDKGATGDYINTARGLPLADSPLVRSQRRTTLVSKTRFVVTLLHGFASLLMDRYSYAPITKSASKLDPIRD